MGKRIWPGFRAAAALVLYAGLTVAALTFADRRIGQRSLTALRQLDTLAHLPEQPLGQTWTAPALVRGNLYTKDLRRSPRGVPSAVWFAWVEDVRKSGRTTTTTVVCARSERSELELRDGEHTVNLELIDDQNSGTLLKGRFLESLRTDLVALDFGPSYSSRTIPPEMRTLCIGRLPPGGNLTYYEAAVPIGSSVMVLGCASPGTVHTCDAAALPPGFISVRGLRYLLRAYANDHLDSIRGAAICVGVALSLLAAALFKLREEGGS